VGITVVQHSSEYEPAGYDQQRRYSQIMNGPAMRESQAIVDWLPRKVLVPVRAPQITDVHLDRLIEHIHRDLANERTGCHTWSGAVTKDGYGSLRIGEPQYVHRLIWQVEYGTVPSWVFTERGWEPVVLDHACHNRDLNCREGKQCPHRKCARPDHLRLATKGTNARLGHRHVLAA